MLPLDKLKDEACEFRSLIDSCDKENTSLVTTCFPVMNCTLSSMLLSYHFFQLWPGIGIELISAAAYDSSDITHCWLEIGDVVIDITGDQYNIISDLELNEKILENRPYEAVHVSNKDESYLYRLFKVNRRETLVYGFPSMGEDFIEDMRLGYSQLMS